MNQETVLSTFIKSALNKRWIDRYLSLVNSKKGKSKFLKDLYHVFDDKIDPSKVVKDFNKKVWELPAYSYSEIGGFGNDEASLKNAFEKYGGAGCLVVDYTSKYGIYIPETMIDEIMLISV